ncbi:hypothetical protein A8708_26440 [Paenibacillus oryzisoli]|uniref:Uncharacterized protein n=1 Tax=Paenibacillus oryzisoli TaxID=1850517 RepID=A0A198AE81_9BACL|nr:hypothetical protein A8708_26440 [Paenibacillus oryzisoli]
MVEGGLLLIYGFLAIVFAVSLHNKDKEMNIEREAWKSERKDLLDRIQAPTFMEYTNKVVREKKAEQPDEPKTDYDQFVS